MGEIQPRQYEYWTRESIWHNFASQNIKKFCPVKPVLPLFHAQILPPSIPSVSPSQSIPLLWHNREWKWRYKLKFSLRMKLTGASRWFKLNEETDRWKRLVRMAAFPPILSRRWIVFWLGWELCNNVIQSETLKRHHWKSTEITKYTGTYNTQ
jgi:hypothetical protein